MKWKRKRTNKEEKADYITKIQHLEAQDEDHKTEIENLQERNDNLEDENNSLKAQLYTLTKENEKTKEKLKESEKKAKQTRKRRAKNQEWKENGAGHTPGKKQAGGGTPRPIGSSQRRNPAAEKSKTPGRSKNMATRRFKLQRYPPPAFKASTNKCEPPMGRNPQWSKGMDKKNEEEILGGTVILLAGTNDLKLNKTRQEVSTMHKETTQTITEKGAKPIIVQLPPVY